MQISSKVQIVSEKIMRTLSVLLASRSVATPLRVCSIGCGTGELDRVWLSKLQDQFPDLTVEYVGVDIDDTVCQAAEDNVGSLDFVTSKIYCQDIQEGLVDEVVKFDFFLSISSFYFIKTPDKVLDMCRKLTSPEGKTMSIYGNIHCKILLWVISPCNIDAHGVVKMHVT